MGVDSARPVRTGRALLLVTLAAIVPAADAGASVRVAHDEMAEIRFTLDGRSLTATVVDLPRYERIEPVTDDLWGRDVSMTCGTSFRAAGTRTAVGRRVRWPRRARSMTVRFGRDISRRAKWCLVEAATGEFAGGDVAFVSFRKAEPGRRLTSGTLRDGTPWRVVTWRGNRLQPCIQLRLPRRHSTDCFDDQAEIEAGIEADSMAAECSGQSFVLGVVTRAAVRVEIRTEGGAVLPATLRPRPRGSRVRAQYFTALLDSPPGLPATVTSVTAYDAAGRVLARQRWPDGSGTECARPTAGLPR